MSQLNEFNQNNLLFKRFQGKVQTNILTNSTYANESDTKSLKNVYNDTIFSSNVSKDISQNYTCFNLDSGPNIIFPNIPNVPDTSANSFTTGIYGNIDIVDTTNLRFYKKVFLKNVSSTPYSWWLIDPIGADPSTDNNLLKDMIPYSYNDLDLAMFTPIVYYYTGTVPPLAGDEDDPNNWTSVEQQQPPLYWLIDYESGVLQLYAEIDSNGKITGTEIIIPTTNPPNAYQVPRISFIKYVGKKGAAGGGGGGDASGNLDLSGNLSVGGDADISGNLTVVGDASFCNVLVNCDLDVSGNTDMSGNLNVVGDASFCNVLVNCDLDVSGNTDMSGNLTVDGNLSVVGDADFCNVLVRCDLDVSGNTDLSQNLLQATASTDLTASGVTDYNAYFRQSNIIDSMKLPFSTYFDGFWAPMVNRTITGTYAWRQGNPCPFGPNLIPIAKIDINGSYSNTTTASQEPSLRPLLANTIGYFTVKFAQPSMENWTETRIKGEFSTDGTWNTTMGPAGTGSAGTKPGYNCIPEQTIHFVAGYQEQQYNVRNENRNPKPFIKILSCSFGDIRNVNGETIIFTTNDPVTDSEGAYTGNKIGGITRIVIAEGVIKPQTGIKGSRLPLEDTSGKAWLFLEQTWAYEGWMLRPQATPPQEEILRKICGDHNIEVRLYSNNTGAKMPERHNRPLEMNNANMINTDWQLLSNDLMNPYIQNWKNVNKQPSFLLEGLPGTVTLPTGPLNFIPTLFVGGQQNPPTLIIGVDSMTLSPQLWFVDLNIYNWPYGITTTKEIFKNDVDIYGNVDICGNLTVQNSIFENITVTNNLDVRGNTTLKNTTVDGKIRADIVESSGNSIFVSYKNYNNSDFLTSTFTSSTPPSTSNWCTIAELDSSVGKIRNSCIFQIIDKTGGLRQNLTFIIGVNEGNQKVFTINVLENNYSYWLSSSGNPKMPLIRNLQIIESSSNKYFLQLDRIAYYTGTTTTNLDVRLYLNTNDAGSVGDPVVPWILKSTVATGPPFLSISLQHMIYDINGIPEADGNIITNMYSVNLNGAKFCKRVDMSNKNIENINQLKGYNNTINFNNSGNLKLNAQNKLEFGTNTSTNDISYNNNILDFQSTNIIENLSNINQAGGNITIGNSSNNVSLNAKDININSSNDTIITSTNDININFTNGTMIVKSSNTLGHQPIEYSDNKLNLRTADLEVKTITNTTKDYSNNPSVKIDICGNVYEFTKTELDFNNKNIQNVSELNTTGTTLNIGSNTSGSIIFDSDSVEMETLTLNNTRITTNSNTTLTSVPYSWGIKYIEQEDASDTNLVGMYKQIRSGFITSNTNFTIIFATPTTNTSSKLPLDNNEIWDLSNSNFSSTNRQFTISNNISRTKMTINIQLGIKHTNNSVAVGHTISQLIEFWLGKNTNPQFKNIFTIERSYNFNKSDRLFWYSGTITLIGGDSTFSKDFVTNDEFYFTCRQSGTASNSAIIEQSRINITWEALN